MHASKKIEIPLLTLLTGILNGIQCGRFLFFVGHTQYFELFLNITLKGAIKKQFKWKVSSLFNPDEFPKQFLYLRFYTQTRTCKGILHCAHTYESIYNAFFQMSIIQPFLFMKDGHPLNFRNIYIPIHISGFLLGERNFIFYYGSTVHITR